MKHATKGPSLVRTFARNLRATRLRQGLTQEELADRASLHRTYVGSVERGERNVTLDSLDRIAKALGVTAVDLLTVKET